LEIVEVSSWGSALVTGPKLDKDCKSLVKGRLGGVLIEAGGTGIGGYLIGGICIGGKGGGKKCEGAKFPMKGKGGGGNDPAAGTGAPRPGRREFAERLTSL
jgi:hypothetical protein